jgi:two-component system chemotaxis response regulator CheB
MSAGGKDRASDERPPEQRLSTLDRRYATVVVGASAGGVEALTTILGMLPADFPLPILVVQHLHASDDGRLAAHLGDSTALTLLEPRDKEAVLPGHVYVAPANYHMLVERNGTIALSVDDRVNWSRPSIDVLFESASRVWGARLIAVILSGANHDGAEGMRAVKSLGGLVVAQDPASAEHAVMPLAAIGAAQIETVLPPCGIAELLIELGRVRADAADTPPEAPDGGRT